MLDEKLLVFVLGAPGAGKGTQCDLIVKEYGWTHISAGDLLRAQVAAGTDIGKEAEQYLKQGTMVPASMIIGLLKDALSDHKHSKVLIDGFPRVLDQLKEFEKQVRPCDKALFYNVEEEAAQQRLLKRGETSGRCDDNEETIRNRFIVFKEESMPVVQELEAEGKVAELDAALPVEKVFAATRLVIEELELQLQEKAKRRLSAAGAPAAEAAPAAEPAAAPEPVAAEPAVAAPAVAAPVVAAAAAEVAASPVMSVEVGVVSNGGVAGVVSPVSPVAITPTAMQAAASTAAAASAAAAAAAEAAGVTSPRSEPDVLTVASLQMDLSGIRTPVVICGPSGVGKGTLINKLMSQYADRFGFSVSHTTRAPRPGEQHGVHYYYTDTQAMAAQVAAGMFLEHADVHGNMYGTSLAAVARVSAEGKHCVLDIDVQGAVQVRKSALGPHCLFIFIAPPSNEELERRLRNRGTETEDKVLQRLSNATAEIAKAQEPGLFHHVLVNADLELAYQELQRLIEQRVPGLLPIGQPAAQPAEAAAASAATSQRSSEAGSTSASTSPLPAQAAVVPAAAVVVAAAANASAAPQQPLPNGTIHAVAGSTTSLLDFGFGVTAGTSATAKGMPVRQYMDATVIPVLRDGLKALNAARPDDPLQFLADYLVAHKAAAH